MGASLILVVGEAFCLLLAEPLGPLDRHTRDRRF
jgi:hypothetical protein